MHRRRMTAVYAAAHFFVDGCCALVVCRFARPDPRWLTAVLLYNFCAFALQAPLGLLADRLGHGRVFAMTGCLLIAATPLLSGAPVALSVLAGVGNALFHIGGGRDVLCESDGRAGRLGVFVSPGAFGLFLGQLLRDSLPVLWLVPLLMILCALAVAAFCPALPGRGLSLRLNRAGRKPLLSLALLFAVVALRSCGGFLFRFDWKQGTWLWVFTGCVVLGKTAGGFAMDRFGAWRTAAGSLALAALGFLGGALPAAGCLAVLLFNMTMPVTLREAADLLPGAPGFSFGLLTLALFLGFLPAWLGWPLPVGVPVWTGLCLISLALMLPAVRRHSA